MCGSSVVSGFFIATNQNNMEEIKKLIKDQIENLGFAEKVDFINDLRGFIHEYSPFKNEPVDFVKWIVNNNVVANEYNPNKVAPPEMELLEVSIMNDGYTQPIVTWPKAKQEGVVEVVDGFHRSKVGKESVIVNQRIQGYLPTVIIRKEQQSKNDRIASTIRHNRARGKHQINAMSEIVLELKNRNWKNKRIARELGMDEEEILRLCQISGLEEMFKDDDFSNSWIASDSIHGEYEELNDDISDEEALLYRTVNTSDPERIFHTFDKWECHKTGFYKNSHPTLKKDECEQKYKEILSNTALFSDILSKLIIEWKYSCEHYLTNKSMNRISWLGQAAVCYHAGVPSKFCGGWSLLTPKEQEEANNTALKYLNIWLSNNNREEITLNNALSKGRQVNIY